MTQHSPRTDTQPSPDDVGRRLSDPGDVSRADTEDEVLAGFIKEYDAAADRAAVLQKYLARFPRFAGRIDSLARAHALAGAACAADPPPARTLQPGDQLGDFTIVRLIASGGMGEVYEAWQGRLNRTVAVKVIRRGRISPEARERFDREQRTLAKLHQTHIVPIHTSGEAGEVQFFAMAYIAGAAINRVVQTAYDRETAGPRGSTPALRELAASATSDAATVPSTTTAASAHRDPDARFLLSPSYIRSVAELMVQAAEAVQHAHDAGVCHRDIKPSNLMVDRDGHCWIIDFGLAGHLTRDPGADTDSSATALTRGAMGTPQYMAPEQYEERPEYRSDVWALGATLYELLTLRRAFDGPSREAITAKVLGADPRPVRDLVPTAPRDLAAICRKAMRKAPSDRYQTAADFAADLRRWLNREPVTARPARLLRRVSLWSARNPGWAVAITCTAVAATAIGILAYSAADERAREEKRRFVELARQQEREQAVLEAQQLLLGDRQAGWSHEALNRLERARSIRAGDELRDHAAATLIGVDVTVLQRRNLPHGASGVAFDAEGKKLLLGGTASAPSHTWDGSPTSDLEPGQHTGAGPVAFRPDGTPIQVVRPTTARWSLLLCDPRKPEPLAELPLPLKAAVGLTVALAPEATHLATSVVYEEGRPSKTFVWKLAAGPRVTAEQLHDWPLAATALAFSPDGRYLAAGTASGSVSVRELANGGEVARFSASRMAIHAMAFGRNFWAGNGVSDPNAPEHARWLVAVGGKGGKLSVWKLHPTELVNTFRGSVYDVAAVALSADGATLLSAARTEPILWDVATGRILLKLWQRNVSTGVAFSRNGRRIAISSVPAFGYPGGLDLVELDESRGVHAYRGLSAQVRKVWLSPSGRFIAALADDWHLGLWEAATGQVRHVLDVPPGAYADNAALAFGRDEKDVVFSAGSQADRWQIEDGCRLNTWKFAATGLGDRLAVLPSGKVLLFRVEPEPRRGGEGLAQMVCRGRELNRDDTFAELYRLTDFPQGTSHADLSTEHRDGPDSRPSRLHRETLRRYPPA